MGLAVPDCSASRSVAGGHTTSWVGAAGGSGTRLRMRPSCHGSSGTALIHSLAVDRKTRPVQKLDPAAGDLGVFTEPARDLPGALRHPGIGTCLCHRPGTRPVYPGIPRPSSSWQCALVPVMPGVRRGMDSDRPVFSPNVAGNVPAVEQCTCWSLRPQSSCSTERYRHCMYDVFDMGQDFDWAAPWFNVCLFLLPMIPLVFLIGVGMHTAWRSHKGIFRPARAS